MRVKLVAFVISGAITGLAGALFADLNRFVAPTMFSWHLSGELLIIFIILGGIGRLFGPVVGGGACSSCSNISWAGLSEFWLIYVGAILLGVVLFARGGLIGALSGREVAHD
jgi:branched-chain amino acid transport system permease protein